MEHSILSFSPSTIWCASGLTLAFFFRESRSLPSKILIRFSRLLHFSAMNETYPQCSWGNTSYPSEPQGRTMYANTMPPHHPPLPQQAQPQEGMYGPPGMGYLAPSSGVRGVPTYHHRGSPAAAPGGYYAGGYIDTPQAPPPQGGPMTSPNPRGCYSANTSSSMDITNSTSGYASPGTAARLAMGDDYMTGHPVVEAALKPSANPSTPTSASSGAGTQPDHRWFSSAQICLP